jgi:ribonuclease PH
LFGPSECRFASKQDHTKAIVEINLKMSPDTSMQSGAVDKVELRAELKSCLE